MWASSDGQAPAVTEGVPPCDLAKPVGDDNFAWSGAKALDVRKQADLVKAYFEQPGTDPNAGRCTPGPRP